jgi:DNA-directed RNA polymerase specialized sigma24 family protein
MASSSDRDVFVALYPGLRRFAACVGPIEVEPDDLVQEALVRVLERQSLGELDSPGAYLRRTISNLASNHRRRFGTLRTALVRLNGSARVAVVDEYPSDLAELWTLSPKLRAALYLSVVEGYDYDDIGELLGCSAATARRRVSRARSRLRKSLAAEVRP